MSWRMACHLAATPVDEPPAATEDQPPAPATATAPPVAEDPQPAPAAAATPASGVTVSRKGVTRTPRRVLGTYTTTTPPRPPVGGPPPSTPKQRSFARDLGADVDTLDIAAAGKVIELARYKRASAAAAAAAASPSPPRQRGPSRIRLRHPDTGRRFTSAELRRFEEQWVVAHCYPGWAIEQLEAQGVEFTRG